MKPQTSKKNPDIQFTPKTEKIIEAILHIAHNCTDLSRYRIVKLIYLADKEHLNRFGRPITFDRMVAMENGPVPSTTYSLLKRDGRLAINYKKLPFDFVSRGKFDYIENPKRAVDEKKLSKSDIKILDVIIKKYGQESFGTLFDITHEHSAYKNAWRARDGKNSKVMRVEDMIEDKENKKELIEELRFVGAHIH